MTPSFRAMLPPMLAVLQLRLRGGALSAQRVQQALAALQAIQPSLQAIKEGRKEERGMCACRRRQACGAPALQCTAGRVHMHLQSACMLQVRAAAWSLPTSRSPCMHACVDAPTATLLLLSLE